MAERRYGGITLGGIIVIVGIVLMFVWSFLIGLIVALIGLIAFGGFARVAGDELSPAESPTLRPAADAAGARCAAVPRKGRIAAVRRLLQVPSFPVSPSMQTRRAARAPRANPSYG